jgi:HSP20 family molecular chaperone IbpA
MAPPRDPLDWMWLQACEMLQRAEDVHAEYLRSGQRSRDPVLWQPPVDMFETPEELWIVAALPGIPPEQVSVTLEAGTMVVSGRRQLPPRLRRAAVHRLEIPIGRFERRIPLPAGRYDLAARDAFDGCIVVALRKQRSGMP